MQNRDKNTTFELFLMTDDAMEEKSYPRSANPPEVQEAAIDYGAQHHLKIAHLLNPKKAKIVTKSTASGDFAILSMIKTGVSKEALLKVGKEMGLTLDDLCQLMHISPRTVQRKSKQEALGPEVSERVIELATVLIKGQEVLGSKDAVKQWIRDEILALGHKRPIDLLDSSFGVRMVLDVLSRIEHGIYS